MNFIFCWFQMNETTVHSRFNALQNIILIFFSDDFPFSTLEQMKSLLKWLFSSMNPWFFEYLAIKIHQNFSGSSKRTFLHWPFQFKLFIDISSVHKQWRLCVFSFFQSTTCQYWLCIFKIKTSYLWPLTLLC